MESDTIVALSTPPGEGAIGIIRMSGPRALEIALNFFLNKKKKAAKLIPRKLTFGHFVDDNDVIIDEILICYMPAPFTYTKEDIVEINVHGGITLIQLILRLLQSKGARLAEPGEFTKRAFLNGRIDLIQAESILAVIQAKSEKALKAAQRNLGGFFSESIRKMSKLIGEILTDVEADLEFYQDDLEDELTSYEEIKEKVKKLAEMIAHISEKSKSGKILRDGLKTVIGGRPNVGKSSLYNYFLGEERAIVSEIPGTTRDLLVEFVKVRGIPIEIIDTAGIHLQGEDNPIEKIGIDYSKKAIREADLIIFLLDASTGITEEDMWIYKDIINKNSGAIIFIANKIDLGNKIDENSFRSYFNGKNYIKTSIKTGEGLDLLEDEIEKLVFTGKASKDERPLMLLIRQEELIQKVRDLLQSALNSLEQGIPLDLISIDLRLVEDLLGELLGEKIKEDVLGNIFAKFCIGK
ncbi:MAG TPA: tRNA uridine-5-carboxymethylaminomethyl(34) synthesis GTPase MnmE [Firmicutes bacterium]|jgi:tRNA modification GTPase|nr:tRNA uridine-5-carboxymethylaminomethyl(34) synthesis GTPase MnmE [Bacillota bacterium]